MLSGSHGSVDCTLISSIHYRKKRKQTRCAKRLLRIVDSKSQGSFKGKITRKWRDTKQLEDKKNLKGTFRLLSKATVDKTAAYSSVGSQATGRRSMRWETI
ncbi:uncharacterized protein [Pocillopora verrucosa]|uniref:uncharacterized protein isoform X3 n=1 Tax=Pocillopora verrucosa TaxID=203993 RepID=UPI00333EAC10